ncbi:hypothetical protein D0863_08926 [Hortaea werneckii]|uniref:BTB domain-containing protein n=1 Tax=Hortaea werneckii TaxID=91943 RepID=A0A3M7DMW6_HORWE|nr:hypothetical protein D0863_08926 [Hortaea werneckii]
MHIGAIPTPDNNTTKTESSFEAFNIAKMPEDNVPRLKEALQQCFETGEYADMTITCSGRTWQVHKVVVCSQVPFFAKAVTGKFKIKDMTPSLILHQESRDSCIDLVDDDPSAVDAMLRWLYYGTFQVEKSKPPPMSPMLFLAKTYKIADKYLLAEFRTTAGENLRAALNPSGWDDVEDLLGLIEELFAGTDESSKTTPEVLRTWVITATCDNYDFCFHSSPSHVRFNEVASSRPDFLSDVKDLYNVRHFRENRERQGAFAESYKRTAKAFGDPYGPARAFGDPYGPAGAFGDPYGPARAFGDPNRY